MNAANRFTLHNDPEQESAENSSGNQGDQYLNGHQSLRDQVTLAMARYFDELDGQPATELYQLVLEQVECPLLEAVMHYTQKNQSRAAEMLGLNRGTLRKKLKQYNLI